MSMNPGLRDELAAFVETDDMRLRIVRTLERKGEALTTGYFLSLFPNAEDTEVLESLGHLEQKGVLKCMTYEKNAPASWDLSTMGREILYALERPVRPLPPRRIIRAIADKIRDAFSRTIPASQAASAS